MQLIIKIRKNSLEVIRTAIALLILLGMLMCVFPTYAFAEENVVVTVKTQGELVQAIEDAGTTPTTIQLEKSIEFISFLGVISIPSGADITIQPTGQSVTFSRLDGDTAIFSISAGGKLTLRSDGDNKLAFDGKNISAKSAALVSSGTLVTENVDFMGNITTNGNQDTLMGGAILSTGASASCSITGGLFKTNKAAMSGGAIAVLGGTLAIDGAAFEGNTVANSIGNGGAVYCKGSAIDFKNASFSGNSAMAGGAVEFTSGCTGTIENCSFTGNRADGLFGKGGALDIDVGESVHIISGRFENNYASTMGGAIYTDGNKSDLFMTRVLFDSNTAFAVPGLSDTGAGGAIWHCPLGTAHYYSYSGMVFYHNTAETSGADLYFEKAKAGHENGGEYVSDKTYAGDEMLWCYDRAGDRFDPAAPQLITDSAYYKGSNLAIAMKSNLPESDYLNTKDAAVIVFKGNTSACGGAIANNGFAEVGYKSGLTIEKEVTGEGAPTEEEFEFTVHFSDGGTYDGVASGDAISLKSGERILISNIPQGIKATVTETPQVGYTAQQAVQTATIGKYGTELLFVNAYAAPIPVELGSLSVQKLVTGNGDKTREWTFTVALTGENLVEGALYPYTGSRTGVLENGGTLALKHGEAVTINDVPAGSGYVITEAEADSDGYTTSRTGDTGTIAAGVVSAASFTNDKVDTPAETVSVSVQKVWNGDRNPNQPQKVQVQLWADGTKVGAEITLNAENEWKHIWQELPVTKELAVGSGSLGAGDAITYTVTETTALSSRYHTSITGSAASGFVITNTYTAPSPGSGGDSEDDTISIAVEKVWKGVRDPNQPDSIEVQLYRNGKRYGKPVRLNADNNWRYMWEGLSDSDSYTVDEASDLPPGYKKTVTGSAAAGFVITNTYDPGAKDNPDTGASVDLRVPWMLLAVSMIAALALLKGGPGKRKTQSNR